MSSYKPSRLGVYDGTDDPEKFIQDFRIQALYQDWNEAKQITNFPIFLSGKAKRVLDACADKDTIKKAIDAVLAGCKPPDESLLYKFYDRKLKKNEKISSFALVLQELLLVAMPTLNKAHMETMLRAQLCCSLSPELKQLVTFTAGTLTWDQLLIKLDQTCATSSAQGPSSSLDSQIKTEQQIKTEPIDSLFTEGRRNDRRSDKFFDRSRLGPLNNDRYDRSRLNPSSNDRYDRFDRSRVSRRPHFDGECNYCHTYGHKISECFKRNRVLGRQQGPYNSNQ